MPDIWLFTTRRTFVTILDKMTIVLILAGIDLYAFKTSFANSLNSLALDFYVILTSKNKSDK